jgi:hypothetical protein
VPRVREICEEFARAQERATRGYALLFGRALVSRRRGCSLYALALMAKYKPVAWAIGRRAYWLVRASNHVVLRPLSV